MEGQVDHRPRGSLAEDVLLNHVRAGLTVRAIAAAVDRSPTTVRYWLKRFGLQTRPRTREPAAEAWCDRHGLSPTYGRGERRSCSRCRADAVSEWRRRAKRRLVEEAGGRCQLCGYDRSVGTLHFHHVDPATKAFALGGRGLTRSIAALRVEAAKCVLLCANCHSEVELGVAKLPAA